MDSPNKPKQYFESALAYAILLYIQVLQQLLCNHIIKHI